MAEIQCLRLLTFALGNASLDSESTFRPQARGEGRGMAWDDELFEVLDDLEQQAEAAYDAERGAELADRSRSAYQEVTFASRLMASVGSDIAVDVLAVGAVRGTLERVGTGWCLLAGP